MILCRLILQPVITCRAAGLPLASYCLDTLLATTARTLLLLLPYFMAVRRALAPDYRVLLALGVLQTALFMPLAMVVVFSKEDRRVLARGVIGGLGRALSRSKPTGTRDSKL